MFFKTISMVLCIFCVRWIIFTFIIHFYIQIVPNLTNRNALKQFLCPFGMSFLFFKYFNTFLAQYVDILDSSWSFSPPVQESSISPKIRGSFQSRRVFRNQNLESGCAYCYEHSVIVTRLS